MKTIEIASSQTRLLASFLTMYKADIILICSLLPHVLFTGKIGNEDAPGIVLEGQCFNIQSRLR
jgi:hypothetical protein